jgi:hypothetical protein
MMSKFRVIKWASLVALCLIPILGCAAGGLGSTAATQVSQLEWRGQIAQVPPPSSGCFHADYPSLTWRAVACITAPHIPLVPRSAQPEAPRFVVSQPAKVGGGSHNDYAALVRDDHITHDRIKWATGTFPFADQISSETDSGMANHYSLQLNTKPFNEQLFNTPLCTGHATCIGWQQFVYQSDGYVIGSTGFVHIQNWLVNYNAPCPQGWQANGGSCFMDGPNIAPFVQIPVTNADLESVRMSGFANKDGNDWMTIVKGTQGTLITQPDSILHLAESWQGVEFILAGYGSGSQAVFNPGAVISVKTTVVHNSAAAPMCVLESYTGETNNLGLTGVPAMTSGSDPAIEDTQSTIAGTPFGCARARYLGVTHLRTFDGLFYDFHATGDFVLAQTSDFLVQTRQKSGAPKWPNASVNQAVATQMGATRVAVCASEAPLVVDGKPVALADGKTLIQPSGVSIARTGYNYLIRDQQGNSVLAEVKGAAYLNVSVGMGTWPTEVHGLLANANGNVTALAARDGAVLNTPLAFEDLYRRYGESWRVAPDTSLLTDCGGAARENGTPTAPFFARNLDTSLYTRGHGVCMAAGIKDPTLLDACTLDVTVLGTEGAANAFVGEPAPVAVGEIGQTTP